MKTEKEGERIETRTAAPAPARAPFGALARAGPLSERYWRSPIEAIHEFDRYFDEMRDNMESLLLLPAGLWNIGAAPLRGEAALARADLEDTGKEFAVVAELPGFEKDGVTIEVSEHGIDIEARREEARSEQEKERGFLARERTFARVRRSFEFPEDVVPEKAEAELRNGLLRVKVPKKAPSPSEKRTRVTVK